MKNTIKIIILLTLVISVAAYAITPPINFSGSWKLDHDKTKFSVFGEASTSIQLDIIQTNEGITIKRTSKSRNGELHDYTEKLLFNGQVAKSVINGTVKTASVKWSLDNKNLIETADYHNDQVNISYKATETWTWSAESKTLTIDRVDDGDDGHGETKAVYNKN